MDYLYITLNKATARYSISLDEIFLTLYGFNKKRKISLRDKKLRKQNCSPSIIPMVKDILGVVYRVKVTKQQHDDVRDILCDFLLDSRGDRHGICRETGDLTSAEFIAYILDRADIISFEDSANGIAEEDLLGLAVFDQVDVVYEGNLKQYCPEKVSEPVLAVAD
jgi:hypothetical protein